MPCRSASSRSLLYLVSLGFFLALASFSLPGQTVPGQSTASATNPSFDLDILVRDPHGNPLETGATVKLSSPMLSYYQLSPTQSNSGAHFGGLMPGEYEVELNCPGYKKYTDRLQLVFAHESLPIYIYLTPESAASSSTPTSPAPKTYDLPQHLRGDMQKGMQAIAKDKYDIAQKVFLKLTQKAPSNPDVFYYLGLAELGLEHADVARDDFKHAISLDPNHDLALLTLGHMQLRTGALSDAVATLEKAASLPTPNWRACFDLSFAYFKLKRLSDAETQAARAVQFAKDKGAAATKLLGQIQYQEGKRDDCKHTFESLLEKFPNDPLVADARIALQRLEAESAAKTIPVANTNSSANANSAQTGLALPTVPEATLTKVVERPWAPPDIDSATYEVAANANCKTDVILDSALHRMRTQLLDFEKFTATEHIEHQEIDRYGYPGAMKARDFSYLVFVYPLGKDSFYLQESRDGRSEGFEEAVATTALNSMGVNILQSMYRNRFVYACEGLSSVRGQGAWQIHFAQKPDAKGEGLRRWQLHENTYEVPIKGRIWISSATYSVLRVETDLQQPVKDIQLTRDHLLVDYGPVNFSKGTKQLWLPWSADMYIEVRGKRYHHRHYLSDYLMFEIDTTHKVTLPKDAPSPDGPSQ